jgi:hypothetical protein
VEEVLLGILETKKCLSWQSSGKGKQGRLHASRVLKQRKVVSMPSGKKRKRAKIAKHKRKKRLRKNRHKKK